MKFLIRYLLLTICVLLPTIVWGQNVLTLEDAIKLAQDSAIAARQTRHEYEASKQDYQSYMASRLWSLGLNVDPNYTYRKLSSDERYSSMASSQNILSTSAGLNAQQLIGKTGGYVYANSSVAWNEYLGEAGRSFSKVTGNRREFNSTPLRIGYRQDFLGFNESDWQLRTSRLHMTTADKRYISTLASIAETTARYFFDYATRKAYVEMYELNAQTADSLYKIGQEKFAITAIRKDELISLQLSLLNAQNTLRNARRQEERARHSLLSYLNLPEAAYQDLKVILPEEPAYTILIDPDEALHMAETYNPAFSEAEEQILAAEQEVERTRKEQGLKTSIDVSVGLQQYDSHLGDLFGHLDQPYVLGTVSFDLPLVDHGQRQSRHRAAKERLETHHLQKQETTRSMKEQILNTIIDLQSQQQLLSETQVAMRLADESYEQNQYNYAMGLSDINTFSFAQSRKDDAHNNYINALTEFWMAYYRLCSLTLYDFYHKSAICY